MSSEDLGAPAYRKFDVGVDARWTWCRGEILRVQLHGLSSRASEHRCRPEAKGWEKAAPDTFCHTLRRDERARCPQSSTILGFQNEDETWSVRNRRPFLGGKGKTHAGRHRGVIVT